jgi:hypothetical protein
MHRAAALLSAVCVMAPAFAGESLNMREYEERCASYYAQEYGVSFMETFALSWPPTRLARSRFLRVG